MPMAERQARVDRDACSGASTRCRSVDEMRADIAKARAAHAKRFYSSPRHTMEVDFDEWMRDTEREMKRGARSGQPPVRRSWERV